jgi:hypothetical protein
LFLGLWVRFRFPIDDSVIVNGRVTYIQWGVEQVMKEREKRRMYKVEANLIRILLAASLACLNASAQSKPAPPPASAPPKPAPAPKPAAKPAAPPPGAKAPAARAPAGGPATHAPNKPGVPAAHAIGGKNPPPHPTLPAKQDKSRIPAPGPAGSKTRSLPDGKEVRMRANGQPRDMHDPKRGMDVHHGLSGERRVTVQRADHSTVVAERGGRGGYVQRPYTFRGHEFAHRTYYAHGRPYDRFYRPYTYRGVPMEVYAPVRYYPAAFYGWVYNPWAAPAPYAWGWANSPWYGFYGAYFAPAATYANAWLWLTDYTISNALADAYQARIDANLPQQPVSGQAPLSPYVRTLLSEEVRRQIALESAEANTVQNIDPQSSGIARMLTDGVQHVFLVGQNLDLIAAGRECMVSSGDVLQLLPTPPGASSANLMVLASKGGQECGKATRVSVALNDLQDMQNYMRETIDQGFGQIQSVQGKGGLPPEPRLAAAPSRPAPFAEAAPPPEPNCGTEIAQQAQEADKAEGEAGQAAGTTGAATKELALGMTIDEVTTLLGSPNLSADQGGNRKLLVYPDMKITFTAGKVTEIK